MCTMQSCKLGLNLSKEQQWTSAIKTVMSDVGDARTDLRAGNSCGGNKILQVSECDAQA